MAKKKKHTVMGTIVTVVVVAAVLWMKYHEVRDAQARDGELRDENISVPVPSESPDAPGAANHTKSPARDQGDSADRPNFSTVNLSSSRFKIWENCTLIDRRGNDGDSFHIRAPHGSEEVRLYFVDAPESAARTYGNGDTNHQRIAQQGVAMGGLNQHETTQVGVAAKAFTKKLLKGKKFTVATTGESVYRSHRKYAFVIVDWQGQPRYLHELLVAHGLGRIHTKPMTLPDNTAGSRQKDHLRELEKYAKRNRFGAWGVR